MLPVSACIEQDEQGNTTQQFFRYSLTPFFKHRVGYCRLLPEMSDSRFGGFYILARAKSGLPAESGASVQDAETRLMPANKQKIKLCKSNKSKE